MSPIETAADRGARRPRIVVLQHHRRVPMGALAAPLEACAELVQVRGYREPEAASDTVDALVSAGEYDGVVALGGPMGAYDLQREPHLVDSLRLLADALRRGLPILGLCLGSQLLSQALGSPVFNGADRGLPVEVGFKRLLLLPAAADDPVMRIFSGPEPVLFWHRDTHDLPLGAVHLAGTDLYTVAAFRWARNAYGLQFHLEATPEVLREWIEQSPLVETSGIDVARLRAEAEVLEPVILSRAERLIELFLTWAREGEAPTDGEAGAP